MKYLESTFDEYIQSVQRLNIHPKYNKLYSLFSTDFSKLQNIIMYGPAGIGKYSQLLWFLKTYSPSLLKYEKKFSIQFQKKKDYLFKMSDIHYEIDISLLGCNARLLWNDVFTQITDIINTNPLKKGFIVCKNFHTIHSELLDVFYNYMQNFDSPIQIRFIIVTEQISFIPTNILNTCHIIKYPRPSKTTYQKCINPTKLTNIKLKYITNIKNLKNNIVHLTNPHELICNRILSIIMDVQNVNFLELRDHLYNILIYQLDLTNCLLYILQQLSVVANLSQDNLYKINVELVRFFKYYNNNYRPIYHLERIILYISSIVHELPTCIKDIGIET